MKFKKKSALFLKLLTVASVGSFMISEGNAGRFGTPGNSHGLSRTTPKTALRLVDSKASDTSRFRTPGNSHGLNLHRTVANKVSMKDRKVDKNQGINLLKQEFNDLLNNFDENQGANVASTSAASPVASETDAQPGILRGISNRLSKFFLWLTKFNKF